MNPSPEIEGWVLVQPETIARTIDALDEMIDELRAEAEAVANRDTGEWTIRGQIDTLRLGQALLIQAVEMDDAATVQEIVAQFEEVEA